MPEHSLAVLIADMNDNAGWLSKNYKLDEISLPHVSPLWARTFFPSKKGFLTPLHSSPYTSLRVQICSFSIIPSSGCLLTIYSGRYSGIQSLKVEILINKITSIK